MKKYYRIGEIAKLYGIGPDSLRYYEEMGILSPIRGKNGYRMYRVDNIWKLNVIRDLRNKEVPMEQIRQYLNGTRRVADTKELFHQGILEINRRIQELLDLRQDCERCYHNMDANASIPLDGALRLVEEPRRYVAYLDIQQTGYNTDEYDMMVKRLQNEHAHFPLIGNSGKGAVLSQEEVRNGRYDRFIGVFFTVSVPVDPDTYLPEGLYLTTYYHGGYENTARLIPQMLQYAQEHGYRLAGNVLEIYALDIHETAHPEEFVTKLQFRVEPVEPAHPGTQEGETLGTVPDFSK